MYSQIQDTTEHTFGLSEGWRCVLFLVRQFSTYLARRIRRHCRSRSKVAVHVEARSRTLAVSLCILALVRGCGRWRRLLLQPGQPGHPKSPGCERVGVSNLLRPRRAVDGHPVPATYGSLAQQTALVPMVTISQPEKPRDHEHGHDVSGYVAEVLNHQRPQPYPWASTTSFRLCRLVSRFRRIWPFMTGMASLKKPPASTTTRWVKRVPPFTGS